MSRLSGMTGFGRAEGALGDWTWAAEARSVNGRGLEVRYRGPQGFDALERVAKAEAQARMGRGQVSVGLQARRSEGQTAPVINQAVLDRYLDMAARLTQAGVAPPTADGLLSLRGVLDAPDADQDEEARAALETAMAATLAQALEALKQSRHGEGAALEPVIRDFIDRIEVLTAQAEAQAAAQTEAIRERFARRMTELAPDAPGLEDRIFLEAAALATKADVREELDRLMAHVASARALLGQPPAGRKLDFLMQEFMREANTLCSKSATTALTGIGLELKAVIEQLREQVQNVE